jgi:small nuclear ribonucleoprotein (snRNP)-like protein
VRHRQYGGSHEGERKLAAKLSKKYGTAVQLLLAESAEADAPTNRGDRNPHDSGRGPEGQPPCHDEAWYELRPNESGSQDLNFLSTDFDPLAALTGGDASEELVHHSNPWMGNVVPPPDVSGDDDLEREGGIPSYQPAPLILDNVEKFAIYLPRDDPLRRENLRKRSVAAATSSASRRIKPKHPFDFIAQSFDTVGPYSVLYKLHRERIRVVIRYVNAIRGTLTGTLLAFDKHMNMILRDVEEVYSPRPVDEHNDRSNLDLELDRRRAMEMEILKDSGGCLDHHDKNVDSIPAPGWAVRKRSMRQILVRGDMVVSVYGASKERKVSCSRYFNRATRRQGETLNATVKSSHESEAQGEAT